MRGLNAYIPSKVKPLCPPEERPRSGDVPYARVTLDNGQAYTPKLGIYQSPEQNTPGPCIIYIFGGGLLWGEYKQVTQKTVYCRDLARSTKKGYMAICPGYRLASQSILPICTHDVRGVVHLLKANGEKHNIDPDRIDALGNSAGDCLASILALSANCRKPGGEVDGNLEYDSFIKAVAIFYAPTDLCQSIRTSAAAPSGPPKDPIGAEIKNVGSDSAGTIPALTVGYTGPGRSLSTLNQILERNDPRDSDWHFIELTRRHSPTTYADADCPPVTVLQGGHDIIANPDQDEVPYHASVKAGAGITFVACPDGGYGPSLGEEIDQSTYNFSKKRL